MTRGSLFLNALAKDIVNGMDRKRRNTYQQPGILDNYRKNAYFKRQMIVARASNSDTFFTRWKRNINLKRKIRTIRYKNNKY